MEEKAATWQRWSPSWCCDVSAAVADFSYDEMDDIYVLFSENLRRRDPLKKNIPFLYSSWSLFPNQHTLIWEHLLLDINKSG
jgi:hypothetical protein